VLGIGGTSTQIKLDPLKWTKVKGRKGDSGNKCEGGELKKSTQFRYTIEEYRHKNHNRDKYNKHNTLDK
jgi:hypothetical protein